MIGIYMIHNKINGKNYIGKSEKSIEKRWKQHLKGTQSNRHLQNAIKKYGIENFEFSVLEECKAEKCADRERYWIAKYESNNRDKGYNSTSGGETVSGFVMSKDAVRKSVESRRASYLKGLWTYNREKQSESTKRTWAIRKANGYKMSDETKQKISESHKGKKMSDAFKLKCSQRMLGEKNPFYGKTHTQEVRDLISRKNKGRTYTEEYRKKCSERYSGKGNPNYGKRGENSILYDRVSVTKNGISFYVHKEELDNYLNDGYVLGRQEGVNDNIRKAKSDKYYFDGELFYGSIALRDYLKKNGYEKISQNTIYRLSKNEEVKGYADLLGRIKVVKKKDENKVNH